jgi:NAD(P)H dehydrogenase (quinone)
MASVYIVYHSGYGHTKLQAEAVHRGAASVADTRAEMQQITGPSPEALNRVGSFTGPMSASFQVTPPHAPVPGDIQTAEAYGKRIAEITQRWVKATSI